jgi:F-type H+-transporting ATPase subunit b
LKFFAKTNRILWFPTLFAKNAKRMGHGALSILFLAALTAGVAIAPFRIAAQEQAVPAESSTASQVPAAQAPTNEKAKPEAAKSEQDETNQFRHTAIVRAAAKALHLSVEATARSFEFINFGIVALAIGIIVFHWFPKYWPPTFFRNRAEKVRSDIETARKATEDANTRLSAVEAKLASLDEEIGRFRVEVEAESLQDEARIKAALEDESTRIVAAAEQEIGAAAAQAKRGLRNFAAELAVEQAAKQMVLTPETDRALIAEFLGDVNKGGQN